MQPLIFYLIYTSISSQLMAEAELAVLLEQSWQHNAGCELTGMLLYMEGRFINKLEGRFMQLLEGSEQDVRRMFKKIEADKRHHHILLLETGRYEVRSFCNWSMGFQIIVSPASSFTPYFFALNDHFSQHNAFQLPHAPLYYLRSFYELNRYPDSM
jgi:hypothetical protein